jgi:cobalt-zinc-cadmium efflux system outer membrane protein
MVLRPWNHRHQGVGLPIGVSISLCLPSCATINPQADYDRTQELVHQSVGSVDVYDPSSEQAIDARIQELIQDGLSVDDATSITLLNNKGLQSLFHEIGIARAEVVQSGLLTNPTFSFGVRFPEGGGRSELTAGLAQQIVDLWQIPVRKRIAESHLEQTVLLITRRAQELSAEVRRHYYGLVAAERAVTLTREHVALTQKSLDVVQARLDVGEADPLEVNLARGSLLDLRMELARLEGDREVAEIALARAMGLSRSIAQWTASDTLPQPRSLDRDRSQILADALSERLDAQTAELAVRLPRMSLFGSVEMSSRASSLESPESEPNAAPYQAETYWPTLPGPP